MIQNVTIRLGDTYGKGECVLSISQEEKNTRRVNVALVRNEKFVPLDLWLEGETGDTISYADGEGLAKAIAGALRFANVCSYLGLSDED
jgi:hypothetical protein